MSKQADEYREFFDKMLIAILRSNNVSLNIFDANEAAKLIQELWLARIESIDTIYEEG